MTVHDPGDNIDFTQWGYYWRTIDFNANRGWSSPRAFGALTLEEGDPRIDLNYGEHLAVWNQDLELTGDFDIACKITHDDITISGKNRFYNFYMSIGKHFAPNTSYKEVDFDNTVMVSVKRGGTITHAVVNVRKNGSSILYTTKSILTASPLSTWLRTKRVGSTYFFYYATTQPTSHGDWTLIDSITDSYLDSISCECGFNGNTGYSFSFGGAYFILNEFGNWSGSKIPEGPHGGATPTAQWEWYGVAS